MRTFAVFEPRWKFVANVIVVMVLVDLVAKARGQKDSNPPPQLFQGLEFEQMQLADCNTDCGRVEVKLPLSKKTSASVVVDVNGDGMPLTPENAALAEWYYLCSSNWTLIEATVVCRSLGFESAFAAFPAFGFGVPNVTTKPRAVDIKCATGLEANLRECDFVLSKHSDPVSGGEGHCLPEHAVGVACRAEGATNSNPGIVEAAHDQIAEWNQQQIDLEEIVKVGWGIDTHNDRTADKYADRISDSDPSTPQACEIHPLVPRPWTPAQAQSAFVFYERVEKEYAAMDASLVKHLCHPERGEKMQRQLVDLVSRGLKWDALGMDLTSIQPQPGLNGAQLLDKELALLLQLYFSHNPHRLMHNFLDQPLRRKPLDLDDTVGNNHDKLEDAMVATLQRDGFLPISNFGIGESALADLETLASSLLETNNFTNTSKLEGALVSSTSGGLVATARVELPVLDGLFFPSGCAKLEEGQNTLADSCVPIQPKDHGRLARVISRYLGPTVLDGYKLTKLAMSTPSDEQSYVASRWHHDRTGRRLKAFVFLHDCDCEEGHPTQARNRVSCDLLLELNWRCWACIHENANGVFLVIVIYVDVFSGRFGLAQPALLQNRQPSCFTLRGRICAKQVPYCKGVWSTRRRICV